MLDSSKLETDPEVARRVPQGAVGDRRDPAGASSSSGVPDPELAERPRRRRFTAEYKLGVLRGAEACTRKGEIGAMLRREGRRVPVERPRMQIQGGLGRAGA